MVALEGRTDWNAVVSARLSAFDRTACPAAVVAAFMRTAVSVADALLYAPLSSLACIESVLLDAPKTRNLLRPVV
jgi:hypothetical protein